LADKNVRAPARPCIVRSLATIWTIAVQRGKAATEQEKQTEKWRVELKAAVRKIMQD
jgi:hypothetical protein